jgi:hypothetical protein
MRVSALFAVLALGIPTTASEAAAPPTAAARGEAPSIEAARRAVEQQVRVAPGGMRDATTTTTPEAEHPPTGVHCRFWYPIVRIDSPWMDDRSASCWTARDWLTIEVELYSLSGPRNPGHPGWEALGSAPRDLTSIASALGRMWTNGKGTAATVAPPAFVVAGDGVRRAYVSVAWEEAGGVPRGTPARRRTVKRVTLLDGWILVVSAAGPVHYRQAIERYVPAIFEQCTSSLRSGKLPGS